MATQTRREITLGGPLYLDLGEGPLDRERAFGRRAPLVVDIGAARARFFIDVAPHLPDVDFLGLEVRKKRVEGALERLAKHGIANCRIAWCDGLRAIEANLAPASVAAFTVLYPDPWPKKRHAKRRVFQQPEIARLLASRLAPGGLVILKSDAAEYFEGVRATLAATPGLAEARGALVEVEGFAPFDLDVPHETYYERKWKDEGRALYQASFRRARE